MSHSMPPPPRRNAGNNNMRQLSNGRSSAQNMGRSHGAGMQRNKDAELMNGVYKNQRFTHGLTKLIGCQVEVQVKNGKHYEGVFKTFSSDLEVVLEYAHLIDIQNRGNTPTKDRIIEKLIVNFNDMVLLRAVDADTSYGETAMSDSFTDTGISRTQLNGSYKESELRQLERWDDGESINTQLEDHSSGGSGWSAEAMFSKNESLGVKSTYDDSMDQYTTKLKDVNTPEYKRRLAEAERHASEIESNQSSRRNTSLENGDEVDEETRYSAVIRPNQQSHPPHNMSSASSSQSSQSGGRHSAAADNGSSNNKPSKYVPPQLRGSSAGSNNGQAQFSQSARFPSGMGDRNRNVDRNNKTSPQTTPSKAPADISSLKKFGANFVLAADNKQPSAENKPPQRDAPPVRSPHTPAKTPDKIISQSPNRPAAPSQHPQVVPVSPTTKPAPAPTQAHPPAPVPEAKLIKAETASHVASAPPTKPAATAGSSATPAAASQSATTTTPSTPNTESKPQAAAASENGEAADSILAKSNLNPTAKEFVFKTPKAAVPAQPPAMAPAHVPAAAAGHPPQHQHYGAPPTAQHKSNKTATVSVVEAKQPTVRQDMPTPAQAMGQPLINSSTHHPHQQPYPTPYMVPMVQAAPNRAALQRNSSYTGSDGQPATHPQQPHFVPPQQPLYMQPGMVTAAGHVVHPQAGMQQPLANMPPPTPPHNAHLQQQPPSAGGSAGPVPQGHQPPHMPPHSTAGAPSVMTHPNQQPNNQHMHHAAAANYPQAGPPSNHQGAPVSYMYAMPQGQPGGQQPPPQQPPLQPSPHNPSPSPAPGNGPMVSQGYHYQPPPSQQFYPSAAAAAQAHIGGAVSQAAGGAPAYHPQLVYINGHPAAVQHPYYIQAPYPHNMAQQYPPNFQPPQ